MNTDMSANLAIGNCRAGYAYGFLGAREDVKLFGCVLTPVRVTHKFGCGRIVHPKEMMADAKSIQPDEGPGQNSSARQPLHHYRLSIDGNRSRDG